ncbi:MAG: hypothetical protein KJ732_01630, partial [Candidatus Margulisbacteria bacterium]|nr:hypothetical protein [Candidatus Margulisiibacteriota bacterium]
YKGRVVRTKNSIRGMMEVAEEGKAVFLGENQGGYIFPDFMPCFDGMYSVCKLIEFLAREKVKLSDLAAEIPPIRIAKRTIPCSQEQKGLVMRLAIDKLRKTEKIEMIDGLKFWQDGEWALILPETVRPEIHLYAEARTEKRAHLLLDKYQKIIEAIKEG